MTGELFATIGLPRSGKTTWCDKWVKREVSAKPHAHPWKPRVIISGDDFRKALYGRAFDINAESTVYANMDVAAKALLSRGFDVILDDTCTTLETVRRYLRIKRKITFIFIDADINECHARANATGRPYLIPVITKLNQQLCNLKGDWPINLYEVISELEEREKVNVSV